MQSEFIDFKNREALCAGLSQELGFCVRPENLSFPKNQGAQAFVVFVNDDMAVKLLRKDNPYYGPNNLRQEQDILTALSNETERLGVTVPALLHGGESMFVTTRSRKCKVSPFHHFPEWVIKKLANFLVGFDAVLSEKFSVPGTSFRLEPRHLRVDIPDFALDLSPLLKNVEAEITGPYTAKDRFVYSDLTHDNIFFDPFLRKVDIVDFGVMIFGDPHYPLSLFNPYGLDVCLQLVREINSFSSAASKPNSWELNMKRMVAHIALVLCDEAKAYEQRNIMGGREQIRKKIAKLHELNASL